MTTPPRTVSVLGVLTVLTLGVVLVIGSCEVPVPITLDSVRATLLGPEGQDDVLKIGVQRDGSVSVNGTRYSMAAVSAVVAPLYTASDGALVISIVADREVPYRFMERLKQELVAAGARRVVFEVVDSPSLRSPGDDVPALLEQSMDLVVRAVRLVYEALESLVVRSPADVAPALVDQGLAIVLPEQGEAVEVSPRNIMHLAVQPSGMVEVKRGDLEYVQSVRPQAIQAIWRQEVSSNPDLIAAVGIHPDTPYRIMREVLDALNSANAERISLKVMEGTLRRHDEPFVIAVSRNVWLSRGAAFSPDKRFVVFSTDKTVVYMLHDQGRRIVDGEPDF